MNKTITIILAIALVISLVGITFLGFLTFKRINQIETLSSELDKVNDALTQTKNKLSLSEKNLSETQTELTQAQSDLANKDTQISSLQADKAELQNERNEFISTMNKAMCLETIDKTLIKNVSTNQNLVDPITKIVESEYGFASINTVFEPVWNNSKTAIFDVVDKDRSTVKVVVSWDMNVSDVLGIYNINNSCYYYLP